MPFNSTFITNDFSKSDMYMFIYLFIHSAFQKCVNLEDQGYPQGTISSTGDTGETTINNFIQR